MLDGDFARLLEVRSDAAATAVRDALPALAEGLRACPIPPDDDPRHAVEAVIAEIDRRLAAQINLILHHEEFRALEAAWRGLWFLVDATESSDSLKIRALDLSKREMARSLRKYRGVVWDQSPLFRKIYDEEYGQLGGEPYGVLIGNYEFDQRPEDVGLLGQIAQIAAAAHAPFIAGAAPSLMQMGGWAELANPRDLSRLFQTPEYTAWRSLRDSEDSRYVGLCLPRFLGRLPYGVRTDHLDAIAFEEDSEGPDLSRHVWINAAFAMAANITRAFAAYGWCANIRGVDTGGIVEGLPVLSFPTADGESDLRCSTEIAISERREAELASLGLMPLVHRKQAACVAFISAQSLQKAREYDDPAATANALLSSRLPYLFASCRFAHYLKCIVRDRIGTTASRSELQLSLQKWLSGYVDGGAARSTLEWQATHPLAEGETVVEAWPDNPGHYSAKFYLRPHYQLEGLTVAMRLVSSLPAQ